MKQVNNGFEDYYYMDPEARVYNAKTEKWLIKDRKNYKMYDITGKKRSISQKKLYELVYDQPFCTDQIDLLEGEEFKPVPNTEGMYLCSNCGRIKSLSGYQARILTPTETKEGYLRVQIKQEGKWSNKLVHCLVATTGIGKPDSLDMEIHHIDFDKKNNCAGNLQYLTKQQHLKKHGERKEQENGKKNKDSTEPKSTTDPQRTNK